MLHTVLEDIQCYPGLGVSWCINAKNSLHCVRGFSPYQLAIGQNPKIPLILDQKAPPLACQLLSKIVSSNLDAIHRARETYIASENPEKIRRSLLHSIRTFSDIKYITGDPIYYKSLDSREWHEPAQVFGQDVQQVLITTVLIPIPVHPCRLRLINQNSKSPQDVLTPPYILNKNDKHDPEPHNKIRKNQHHLNIENSDSEDEDPSTRKSANHHSSN